MPSARIPLIAALAVMAAIPTANAAAANPQPAACPLLQAGTPREYTIDLPTGHVVARDPYGAVLPRTSLFFDFTVHAPGGGRPSGVASVTWALDGVLKRTDPTAPFEWKGVSGGSRMPAGNHRITVAVTPTGGGAPVSKTFSLNATDCPPALAFNEIGTIFGAKRAPGSSLYATSASNSATGPTFGSAEFFGSGVTAVLPAAARGRVAGTLSYSPGNVIVRRGNVASKAHNVTLRVPRTGSKLASSGKLRVTLHPGARGFLSVTGLPSGTREIQVRLVNPNRVGLLRTRRTAHNRCSYSSTVRLSGTSGAITVSGGGSTSVC